GLAGSWVEYVVQPQALEAGLAPIQRPAGADRAPAWRVQKIRIEEPEVDRTLGFYRIRRPPRPNLLPYLAKLLGLPETGDLARGAHEFLKRSIHIPRG